MLRSTALMTLALAFAAPAAAEAPLAKGSFEGQSFEYSSRPAANDTVVIEGRFLRGERFSFTVRPSGRVSGAVGSTPVTFSVSKAQWEKLAKSVSAQPQLAGAATFSAGTN